MHETAFSHIRSHLRRTGFAMATAAVVLASAPVEASLIVTVANVSALSASSGNTLDVSLVNTGPLPISLAGFSFEISVVDSHITFTSATIDTLATYIFAGHSLFGPTISTSASGQTLDASDLWSGVGGADVAAGATVGLGHLFFDVSAGDVSGPVAVTLSPFPATSLSDPAGGNVSIDALTNGSITIIAAPEPPLSMLVLVGLAMLALTVRGRTLRGSRSVAMSRSIDLAERVA